MTHHDWMLQMYKRIGIPTQVIQLIYQLISKWKTMLDIWNGGKKMTSR